MESAACLPHSGFVQQALSADRKRPRQLKSGIGPRKKSEFRYRGNMGEDSKKHHYVPQSILRRFSSGAAQTQLYVFDKLNNRSFPSSIRNAGSENYFNTVEVEGQSISFEDLFQANDDELAQLLEHITSIRSLAAITPDDRSALSQVIAVQIVRTKMVRTTVSSVAEQFAVTLSRAGFEPDKVDGFSIPTDQDTRRAALKYLFDLDGIISALNVKCPILIHSSDSNPFWISDNPIVLHNTFPYGERGLYSPGIEIYFPISSDLVLGLFCPSIEKKISEMLALGHLQLDRDKYAEIPRGLQVGDSVSLGPETRSFLNSLQILYSSRFLYSPTDDFEHAHEILRSQPAARDVQSTITVGEMGKGPARRKHMPPGFWVVIYGKQDHHLIEVKKWDDSSVFLDFETTDLQTLRAILNDQPITQALLFQDGYELRGMRNVKIEVVKEGTPCRVCVVHQDEGLNQILRLRTKRPIG